jgi:hypothetical protein
LREVISLVNEPATETRNRFSALLTMDWQAFGMPNLVRTVTYVRKGGGTVS